jgi:hypothetical protein
MNAKTKVHHTAHNLTSPAKKPAAPKAPAKPVANKKPRAAKPAAPRTEETGKREIKHGMRRPLAGKAGGKLWPEFDKLQAKAKKDAPVTVEAARAVGDKLGMNVTTVTISFYRWRRFQGVRGRGSKQKVD